MADPNDIHVLMSSAADQNIQKTLPKICFEIPDRPAIEFFYVYVSTFPDSLYRPCLCLV
jgi:hypothetical protein